MDLNSASDTYLRPHTSCCHFNGDARLADERVHRVYSNDYGIFFVDVLKLILTYLYCGCISQVLTFASPRWTRIHGIADNRQAQNDDWHKKSIFDCIDQRIVGTPERQGKTAGWVQIALTRVSFSEMRLMSGVWLPPGRNAISNSTDALSRIAGTWIGIACDAAFLTTSTASRCML
jgi:hypothetical protein